MEQYIKQAVKNSYFVLAMSMLAIFIGYLLRVFLSRSLSLEDFGLFYAISAFMGIFILVRYLGLNQALAKFIPEFLSRKELTKIKSLITIVIISQALAVVLFSVVVFLFKDQIATSLFKTQEAEAILTLMVLSFIPSMFFVLFQSVFQGYQKLKTYALVEPVRIFTTFAFSVLLIDEGAAGVALAYLIASIVTTFIFLFPFLRLGITKYKTDLNKRFISDIFKFSGPVLVSSVAIVFIGYIDTLILTFYKTLDDVALYQVALPTSQLLLIFSNSIAAVSLPLISELYTQKRIDDIGKSLKIMSFLLVLVITPFVILFISSGDVIIGVIFGTNFLDASLALQILSISMFLYSIFMIFQTTLDAIGKPFLNTKIMFVVAFVDIVLNLILVPKYGILGSAMATVGAFAIGLVMAFVVVEKYIKSSIQVEKLALIFVCGMTSAAVVYFVNQFISFHVYTEILFSLVFGITLFLGMIIILGLVTREDIRFIDTLGIPIPKLLRRLARFLLK